MAQKNFTYDLMLLLDTASEPEQRQKILTDTQATIQRLGEVVGSHDYGTRPTSYEMNKKKDAEYHLIQFHATPELLASLEHTLRITDGIQRFRIIKLAPGVGTPPDLASAPATAPVSDEAPTPA
jgi:small subunit ribosomal protein S6